METVVIVLMLLVSFTFLLKQTFMGPRAVALVTIVCGLFTALMWPLAIEQSKTQISDWLANTTLMLNTAVVLTVEVVLQMTFCLLAAHLLTTGHVRRRTLWAYRILRWFPGLLIFPVLFSALVALIFTFPGASFQRTAWAMAAAVIILVPAGRQLLRTLLPEKDLRLELLFLANALIAILGIVATVNGRTAVAGTNQVEWAPLLTLLLLIATATLLAPLITKLKRARSLHQRQ